MKILLQLAAFASLCLPACAQWYTIVPASPAMQSLTLSASLPAGTTYRFVSLNGKATAPVTITAAQTVSSWDDGGGGRPADPDPGIAKAMQVMQSAAYSVSLIDSSVKPAKTTPVPVPAVAATYRFTCTAAIPVGTMPTTIALTCSAGVKQ